MFFHRTPPFQSILANGHSDFIHNVHLRLLVQRRILTRISPGEVFRHALKDASCLSQYTICLLYHKIA
ncbi:MAG: hypothetical protein IJV62_04970, partial [Eggerthellaceae bacterium]|nr:hypothetical protein [Eggerthellaceae bacterium]